MISTTWLDPSISSPLPLIFFTRSFKSSMELACILICPVHWPDCEVELPLILLEVACPLPLLELPARRSPNGDLYLLGHNFPALRQEALDLNCCLQAHPFRFCP